MLMGIDSSYFWALVAAGLCVIFSLLCVAASLCIGSVNADLLRSFTHD